jgi:uncharacterized protein YbcV (DUF1398 family)
MFQLKEIKEAHSKVKSGADFPAYIQALKKLGIKKYDTYVQDGHTVYYGDNEYELSAAPSYASIDVAFISNSEKFKAYLKSHQQGETDYPAFCRHSAITGVEKWTVDTVQMTCTYYDKNNQSMLEEQIPV